MSPRSYEVDDRELLLGLYRRLLFDPVLSLVPDRVHPNAITLFGVACSTLSVVAALGAVAGSPPLYLASALCLVVYLTADNVDGPHARRTGQSSALGELLDHGLDGVANGSVLLTAAIILRLSGIWFLLLALLGAIGFAIPFWEQLRSGRLVLPELSSTEGISMVALLDVVSFAAGEPAWLRFSLTELNVTTGVLLFALVSYAVAIGVPMLRLSREGRGVGELLPPLLLASGSTLYVLGGAAPLWPSVLVSVVSADLVCRMIAMRHGPGDAPLMTWWDAALLAPAAGPWLVPELAPVDAWAIAATGVAAARYARTLVLTGVRMHALD